MKMPIAHLLVFPDEILLEIYKYLHETDVLYAFYGLNARLNRCLSEYFHKIHLFDLTFAQCHCLCRSILPAIGSQIRLLSLNNCLSVLGGKVFGEYFSHRMSNVFPNLEKLLVTCFTADEFERFLLTLTNLTKLKTIEIYDLLTDQSNIFQHLIESNEQRWTSIKFRTSFIDLPTSICVNIRHLTITIRILDYFPQLFALLPQIEYLNVTIDEISLLEVRFDHLPPIENLRHLVLRCYNHFWIIEEFQSLFSRLINVEILSLQFSSQDERFVDSTGKFLSILPSTLTELNLSIRYFYEEIDEIDREYLRCQRFPLICLVDETIQQVFLHTNPYRFPLMNLSLNMAKQMSNADNYRNVEMFYDYQGMSLTETFPIISRCERINEIAIQSYDRTNVSSTGRIEEEEEKR